MAEITISIGEHKAGSIMLNRFSKESKSALKRGIRKAAEILTAQLMQNLSGPSHTKNPGNSNPYPGVLSGNLRRSTQRPKYVKAGLGVIVGPGGLAEAYAAAQEFGAKTPSGKWRPPPRPYVRPAWKQAGRKAMDALIREVLRPLK